MAEGFSVRSFRHVNGVAKTLQMVQRIKNKIFHKIHTGNLVYNTCWEDPRCDRAVLGIGPESRIVMLTSAGCNALDYLLDDPLAVHCVDMNPRQNALLDLKAALIKKSDHETLFRFFGHGKHEQAQAVFNDFLAPELEGFSGQYWARNLHYFQGKGIRKSFYWCGSAGTAAFLVKKIVEASPKTKKLIQQLFDCKDLATQRALYNQLEPRLVNFFTRWLFKQHVFQSMLGVPKIQQDLAKQAYPNGMAGYVQQCFRKVFTEISVADNYFWKVYLMGSYSKDCCPNYLRQENFEILRQRTNRLQTYTATLSQFLQENPGQYSHFILLDHQDWLAAHNRSALKEEWALIVANSAPQAKILLRSAANSVSFIPDFVYKHVNFSASKTATIHQEDRVGTYASVLLGEVIR